ncbi:MAG TPA: hypothetical protein PKL40_10425 [Methanoregulaceae archaeon]|nr:hypothetical protein [Methanoregulaceae archaeon]
MIKLFGSRSNWEVVAFYFIEPLIINKSRRFTRQEVMRNLDEILPLLKLLGHKADPQHPEETLQKTLQNMRDKKWLLFLGDGNSGDYELTEAGYKKMLSMKDGLRKIKESRKEIKGLR